MAGDKNTSEIATLKNTIATQKNELDKLGDPNAEPRIIRRGNQKHPKYEKNTIKVAATLPKPVVKQTKKPTKK